MKAPPPFEATLAGNLKKLPKPIAEPATAIIIPKREPQLSLILAILDTLIDPL
jgi:hypothetical protein